MGDERADERRETEFDEHISKLAPIVRPSGEHRRALRLQLQVAMRRKERRSRLLALAIVSLAALILLTPSRRTTVAVGYDAQVYVHGDTHDYRTTPDGGFAPMEIPEDRVGSLEEAEGFANLFRQMKLAGDFTVTKSHGWTIQGRSHFIHSRDYEIDGEVISYTGDVEDTPREDTLFVGRYVVKNIETIFDLKDRGELEEQDRGVVYQAGHEFHMKTWAYQDPIYGEVLYWEGTPVR